MIKLGDVAEQRLALQLQQESENALANLPHIQRAHAYEAQGSFPMADYHYQQALNRSPENAYLMRHRAKMRTRLGDYTGAVALWETVLRKDPHSRHYQHLAEVYALQQNYPAAIDSYRRATEHNPGDARAYLGWGQVLLAMDAYEEALEKFVLARRYDEPNRVLYTLREAETYRYLGQYRQAVDACTLALIWCPDHPEATKLLLQLLPQSQAAGGK